MKTRLLMLLFNRVGKGTYWRALGFARELVQLNCDVTLMAVSPARKWGTIERLFDGVNLIETPDLLPHSGYDPWDTINRIGWLRGRSFDLIHAFETRPVVIGPAMYLQNRQQVPLITDWCDWFGSGGSVEQRSNMILRTILRPVETFFEQNFRTKAQGTTVINSVLQQKVLALGVSSESVLLLPNGADVSKFLPLDREIIRPQLGLPLSAPLIGYTGNIFQEDAQLMADAFKRILVQQPEAHLLLIGYFNAEIEQWLPETAVIRTGPVTYQKLAEYVAACDLGWLPLTNNKANQGRFPMKVSDFMAAGRPLIVTDVGDLGQFVRDRHIGCVAQDTPQSLAQVTLDMLNKQEELAVKSANARHVAETELAWPIVTEQLYQFYQFFLRTR